MLRGGRWSAGAPIGDRQAATSDPRQTRLWLLGLIGGIGGGFIHLLLIVAAIVLVAQLVSGRNSTV